MAFIFFQSTYKVVNVADSDRKSKEKNMFTHYIEAVSIQNQDRGSREDSDAVKAAEANRTGASSVADVSSSSKSSRKGFLSFNMKDFSAVNVDINYPLALSN